MKYKYIFLDLDGTLWDSREGITSFRNDRILK